MTTATTIEQRVAQLERENRLVKKLGFAAIMLCLVSLAAGARFAESNKFVVEDEAGTVRSVMSVNNTNQVFFEQFDRNGKRLITIGENGGNRENISFYDHRGTQRIFLGFSDTGNPNLTFYDSNGRSVRGIGE